MFSVLIVIAMLALSAWLYPELPDPMPTHWDAAGNVDGYGAKPWAPFVLPGVTAGLAALLAILPRISPRGYTLEGFQRSFRLVGAIVVAFLGFVHALTLAHAAGRPVAIERWLPAGIGVMVALLGNLFGKTTKNFFVGIRTPWTLASDEVWLRTHRLGGKLFVIAGSVVVAAALAGYGIVALPIALGIAALVPTLYSYWLYRRLEGNASGRSDSPDVPGRMR
jgi:uncharacterized membrane protein